MKTLTIEKTVYDFNELSESAQDRALSQHAESLDYEWWDYSDFLAVAEILGVEIKTRPTRRMDGTPGSGEPCIWWSGFSSQGDGLAFESHYRYAKGSCKAIREYAGTDAELHRIADELYRAQKRAFYRLTATTDANRNYMRVEVSCTDHRGYEGYAEVLDGATDAITDALRDLASWMYRSLEREYEYQTSREAFAESCEANEWQFDEFGNIA